MTVTVLICTYNRASLLCQTLDSLAGLTIPPDTTWEVLVVDNNSSDDTRGCVEGRQPAFPTALRYHFEPRQGKSNALNTGFAIANGEILLYTDDDVRVPAQWLAAALGPLRIRLDIAYTGGPVEPIWERRPPAWLRPEGNVGAPLAIKDHGNHPFVFEEALKTPLGVNMAVRRELIERIGGFRPDLGRSGKSLLGQEQAEFFYRSRAAGALGLYVPEMLLAHHVPASRTTHRYLRRWWLWKGISHARLHRIHGETELGLNLRTVRRLWGIPAYILRSIVTDALQAAGFAVRGQWSAAIAKEMMVWYGLGYVRETLLHRAPAVMP